MLNLFFKTPLKLKSLPKISPLAYKLIILSLKDNSIFLTLISRKGISVSDIRNEMVRFTNVVMEFYRTIYRENIFTECPTILPTRCQVALKFLKVLSGNVKDEKNELNMVGEMMPGIRKMMDIYLEQI